MSINLSKVDIALGEFDRISDGDYNAGEVRLAGEKSLKKMNNHVVMRIFNRTTIPHSEVLAIKQAFVTALSRNGLGMDELNSVRVDLGLAPKGGMDTDIGHRSVVPLSRQQIRAILDRHADTINNYNAQQNNGAEHIRKSAEIYRGGRMSDDNIAKRDEVNETLLAGTRIVNENRTIARFQAIVADNADFCGSDERAVRLDIARGLLDALLTKCRGVPGDAEPYVARLKLEGGQILMMPTGLSERDFLARLENIIVRLAKLPSPREEELSTRLEYKRLQTQEEKLAYISALPDNDVGGRRARALAVMLMLNRGIQDYATLALVNTVSNADAKALAIRLASIPLDRPSNAVRNDPDIVAIANKLPVPVDDNFQAYLPVIGNDDYNRIVNGSLSSDDVGLLQTYQTLAERTRSEVRCRLGAVAVADNLTLGSLVSSKDKADLCPSVGNPERITAAGIADEYLARALKEGASRIVQSALSEVLVKLGHKADKASSLISSLRLRHPEIIDDVASAQSPEEAVGKVAAYTAQIENFVHVAMAADKASREVEGLAMKAIAGKLGKHVEALNKKDFELKRLKTFARLLKNDIMSGVKAFDSKEQCEEAFRKIVDDFVKERFDVVDEIDRQDLSAEIKANMKAAVLSLEDVRTVNVSEIVREARKVDMSGLVQLLKAKAGKDEVYDALKPIFESIKKYAEGSVAHKKDRGPDDTVGPKCLMGVVIALSVPGLSDLLNEFMSQKDVKDEMTAPENLYNEDAPVRRLDPFKILSTDPEVWQYAESRSRLVQVVSK